MDDEDDEDGQCSGIGNFTDEHIVRFKMHQKKRTVACGSQQSTHVLISQVTLPGQYGRGLC